MKKSLKSFSLVLLFACSATASHAKNLFDDTAIIDLTIEAPFAAMRNSKFSPKLKFSGKLKTGLESHDISLWFKGNGRRRCETPSLRVDLKQKSNELSVFHKNNEFQILTHCDSDESSVDEVNRNEQKFLRECFVYKFAEAIGAPYFRSRVARIKYFDTDANSEISRLACLLEKKEKVAQRYANHKTIFDNSSPNIDEFPRDYNDVDRWILDRNALSHTQIVEIFSGNGDWAALTAGGVISGAAALRNIMIFPTIPPLKEIVTRQDIVQYKFIPVAYDFDLGSFVGESRDNVFNIEDLSSDYPHRDNFDWIDLSFLLQEFRLSADRQEVQKTISELNQPDVSQKVERLIELFPFTPLNKAYVLNRVRVFFALIQPRQFYRPIVQAGAALYENQSSKKPVCFANTNLTEVLEHQGQRSKIRLFVTSDFKPICNDIEVEANGSEFWVDKTGLSTD